MQVNVKQVTSHSDFDQEYNFEIEDFVPWDLMERIFGFGATTSGYMPIGEGRYLLIARYCPAQYGQDESTIIFEATYSVH